MTLAAVTCLLVGADPATGAPQQPRGLQQLRLGRPAAAAPVKPAITGNLRTQGARLFRGRGFDACSAPSLSLLTAWRKKSPYRAIGIYFGGRARACAQPRLTRAWVRSAHRMGWQLLPLYMGSQPSCSSSAAKRKFPISSKHPGTDGRREAQDAVTRARGLGIAQKSPLYLDIESYRIQKTACARAVLSYAQAWNSTVRARGYFAGFYSSANSGVLHMANSARAGRANLADVMWTGRWNNSRSLSDPMLSSTMWTPHRRVHQYKGDVRESHGGLALSIDRNEVDAPVAVIAS
jgi:Domain of unknown function (DUF1906)